MSSSQRKDQPRIAGFGAPQFVSPVKKRAPKRKQQTRDTFVPDAKRAAIQAKMDALEREMAQKRRALQRMREKPEESDVHNTMDPETPAPDDDPIPDVAMEEADNHIDMQTPTKPKRLVPDDTAIKHFNQWKTLLPALVAPYLRYLDRTMQKQWVAPPTELSAQCERPDRACTWSTHRLTGLIFGCMRSFKTLLIVIDPVPSLQHRRPTAYGRAHVNPSRPSSYQMGFSPFRLSILAVPSPWISWIYFSQFRSDHQMLCGRLRPPCLPHIGIATSR